MHGSGQEFKAINLEIRTQKIVYCDFECSNKGLRKREPFVIGKLFAVAAVFHLQRLYHLYVGEEHQQRKKAKSSATGLAKSGLIYYFHVMKTLFISLATFISFSSIAQSSNSTVFNVYRRDADVITKYNHEFLSSLKKGDVVKTNDSVYTNFTLKYNKDCINEVTLFVTLLTEAKDNRTKMSFIATYKHESDKCPKEGTWEQLEECNKCKLGISLISEAFQEYRRDLYVKYHDFLKRKRTDKENW